MAVFIVILFRLVGEGRFIKSGYLVGFMAGVFRGFVFWTLAKKLKVKTFSSGLGGFGFFYRHPARRPIHPLSDFYYSLPLFKPFSSASLRSREDKSFQNQALKIYFNLFFRLNKKI